MKNPLNKYGIIDLHLLKKRIDELNKPIAHHDGFYISDTQNKEIEVLEDIIKNSLCENLFTIDDIQKAIQFGWDADGLSNKEISEKYNIKVSGYHYENVERFIEQLIKNKTL